MNKVDWDALYGISQVYCMEKRKHEELDSELLSDIIQWLKDHQSQWLHPKPAIDPEIKRVYERIKLQSKGLAADMSALDIGDMWRAIKAYCEKGGV